MARTLFPSTSTTKCEAKNPDTCRVHGSRKPLSPKQWLDQPDHRSLPAKSILTDPAPLARALDSSNTWEGEKPEWWDEYSTEMQNLEHLPSTPELLDIIDTPAGKLAVVWAEHSPFKRDQGLYDTGLELNFVGLYHPETKEYLGYLKAGHWSEQSMDASFGTDELRTYRYLDAYSSCHMGLPTQEEWAASSEEEQLATLQDMWPSVVKEAVNRYDVDFKVVRDGEEVRLYNLSSKHAPTTKEELLKDLRTLEKPFKKKMEEQRNYNAIPYVDFSRAEDPLKGKGYGAALYTYMGRQLAKKNLVLRGATSQTDDAQGLWNRFRGRFQDKVGTVRVFSPYTRTYLKFPVLDFR